MSLVTLLSEYFWLLFAVAISVAVLRELRINRDESTSSESRSNKP